MIRRSMGSQISVSIKKLKYGGNHNDGIIELISTEMCFCMPKVIAKGATMNNELVSVRLFFSACALLWIFVPLQVYIVETYRDCDPISSDLRLT